LPGVRELPVYEAPVDQGARRLGLVAVLVLTAIVAGIVILMCFSTVNTPMSINGHKAEYSHNLDSGK
jgi:hypothetical protein